MKPTVQIFINLMPEQLFGENVQLHQGPHQVQSLMAHVEPTDHPQAARLIKKAIENGFKPQLMIETIHGFMSSTFQDMGHTKVRGERITPEMEEIDTSIKTYFTQLTE